MKTNEYINMGDYTILRITRRNGEVVDAFVDSEDVPELENHLWCVSLSNSKKTYYVKSGKVGQLHRFLMKPEDKYVVDHKDGNGLNNRKSNLRVVTFAQNMQNFSTTKRNKSGERGVYWVRSKQRWQGAVEKDGKIHRTPYLRNKEDVIEAVRKLREELHPFSTI